jgi:hypothetical protein
MNTQGWVRGLIAHNSQIDKFVYFVSNTISKEFNFQSKIVENDNSYIFCFDMFTIEVLKSDIIKLQKKGPYALDNYLLTNLKKKGLRIDINRSQYIEYCFLSDVVD